MAQFFVAVVVCIVVAVRLVVVRSVVVAVVPLSAVVVEPFQFGVVVGVDHSIGNDCFVVGAK